MKRALLSVTNKTGIVELAKGLDELGYEVISTGGTLKTISDAGVKVKGIEEITGFPEILDGRVKTLHPVVHGGILFKRDKDSHVKTVEELKIDPIDVVAVNLYDFEGTLKSGKSHEDIVEHIDIGGPSMVRSAAKNYKDVLILTDPKDYAEVLERIKTDTADIEFREKLAAKAFAQTAYYDSIISAYFRKKTGIETDTYSIGLKEDGNLRYGENPHQNAKLYKDSAETAILSDYVQYSGKELSFNNLNDLNTAVELAKLLYDKKYTAVVALKHATPCATAYADTIYDAYMKAYEGDKESIFGGIVACTAKVDKKTAEKMHEIFLEIIAAPDFDEDALEVLKQKKNLRILKIDFSLPVVQTDIKYLNGKVLIQEKDGRAEEKYDVVTEKQPTDKEKADMLFAMDVCRFAKSNAVTVVKDGATLGIGGGQTSRIWALESIRNNQKDKDFTGAVLASDAFFPFADCVETAHQMGITAIIQPGGSIRDKESIESCNKYGIAMVFTGIRHFRH